MMAFSIVKRIGEGSYLTEDDYFIIERARKERALNTHHTSCDRGKKKVRIFTKNARQHSS